MTAPPPGALSARDADLCRAGNKFVRQGQYADAEEVFGRAIASSNEHPTTLACMGDLARARLEFPVAAKWYLRALRKDPECIQALRGVADAYRGMGKIEDSIHRWQKYLARVPDDVRAMARLGDALKRMGRLAEAEAQYRRAIRLNDRNYHAQAGMGDLLRRQGRGRDALPFYESAYRLMRRAELLPIIDELRRERG